MSQKEEADLSRQDRSYSASGLDVFYAVQSTPDEEFSDTIPFVLS